MTLKSRILEAVADVLYDSPDPNIGLMRDRLCTKIEAIFKDLETVRVSGDHWICPTCKCKNPSHRLKCLGDDCTFTLSRDRIRMLREVFEGTLI